MSLDHTQVRHFVHCLMGADPVGVAEGEVVEASVSPQMRSFLYARLGDMTPKHVYAAMQRGPHGRALGALLREVADYLDPPVADTLLPNANKPA